MLVKFYPPHEAEPKKEQRKKYYKLKMSVAERIPQPLSHAFDLEKFRECGYDPDRIPHSHDDEIGKVLDNIGQITARQYKGLEHIVAAEFNDVCDIQGPAYEHQEIIANLIKNITGEEGVAADLGNRLVLGMQLSEGSFNLKVEERTRQFNRKVRDLITITLDGDTYLQADNHKGKTTKIEECPKIMYALSYLVSEARAAWIIDQLKTAKGEVGLLVYYALRDGQKTGLVDWHNLRGNIVANRLVSDIFAYGDRADWRRVELEKSRLLGKLTPGLEQADRKRLAVNLTADQLIEGNNYTMNQIREIRNLVELITKVDKANPKDYDFSEEINPEDYILLAQFLGTDFEAFMEQYLVKFSEYLETITLMPAKINKRKEMETALARVREAMEKIRV